jgi:hypothetical protein
MSIGIVTLAGTSAGCTVTLEEWQEANFGLASEISVTVAGSSRSPSKRRPESHPAGTRRRSDDQPGRVLTPASYRWCRLPLPRKEVIQPHLPVRLPCYDFVPVTNPTFDGCLLAVGPPASGVIGFHDVTGGVYKAREHIHRRMLTGGY